MMLHPQAIYALTEATWPPARCSEFGPFTLRNGAGGGKRVSAATLQRSQMPGEVDLHGAEARMRSYDQPVLFMLREGEEAFDQYLENKGYVVIDPVNLYSIACSELTDIAIPRVTTFAIWEPLAIMRDLWAEGGIGPARLAVMERVKGPKTAILGRIDDQPAATAFVAIDNGIAMLHALEVSKRHRRKGLAQWVMRAAAFWARDNGVEQLAVLCVKDNAGANGLYRGLGFAHVGSYHYRIKPE